MVVLHWKNVALLVALSCMYTTIVMQEIPHTARDLCMWKQFKVLNKTLQDILRIGMA